MAQLVRQARELGRPMPCEWFEDDDQHGDDPPLECRAEATHVVQLMDRALVSDGGDNVLSYAMCAAHAADYASEAESVVKVKGNGNE